MKTEVGMMRGKEVEGERSTRDERTTKKSYSSVPYTILPKECLPVVK